MSRLDDQLQDYLDGRMSDDERRAFEQRLGSDPLLAERIEEQRELRVALREDEPLPPGFYTRTRAAFEARQRRRRPWFGLLSWEALGLVGAAVLALALFGPALLRNEVSLTQPEVREQEMSVASEDTLADEAVPSEPAAKAGDVQVAEPESLRASAPDPEATVEGAARDAPAPRERAEARAKEEALGKQTFAPSPPAEAAPQRPAPGLARDPAAEAEKRDTDLAEGFRAAEPTGGALRWPVVEATALSPGTLPRNAVQEPPTVQRDARVEKKRSAAARRAPPPETDAADDPEASASDRVRVVLIGPRDTPISCSGVRLETRPDRHVIHFVSADADHPVAPGGCAVHVPADGRPVVVGTSP